MRKRVLAILLLSILFIHTAGAEEKTTVYREISRKPRVYELADTGWLVERWTQKYNAENMEKQARSFNETMASFSTVQTYVYLVNSSRTMDLNHLDREPPIWTKVKGCYSNSILGSFEIKTIEDYQKYYYKTDHHWNYRASYEGYTQIIRMLLGKDEPVLKPVKTVTFPIMFNGSYNKRMKVYTSDQPFTVYRFKFPKMSVKVNGKRRTSYGKQEEYFAGKYSRDKMKNHYSAFYGGDRGLVEFNTNQPDKENILVFSNSFSNAVDMLIASHFNRTYFVDLRHYREDMGSDFSLTDSITRWNISKVLLLGDGHFFSLKVKYH